MVAQHLPPTLSLIVLLLVPHWDTSSHQTQTKQRTPSEPLACGPAVLWCWQIAFYTVGKRWSLQEMLLVRQRNQRDLMRKRVVLFPLRLFWLPVCYGLHPHPLSTCLIIQIACVFPMRDKELMISLDEITFEEGPGENDWKKLPCAYSRPWTSWCQGSLAPSNNTWALSLF